MRYRRSTIQGLGIALVAARKAQIPVTLVDSSQASIEKGMKFAGRNPLTKDCGSRMAETIER